MRHHVPRMRIRMAGRTLRRRNCSRARRRASTRLCIDPWQWRSGVARHPTPAVACSTREERSRCAWSTTADRPAQSAPGACRETERWASGRLGPTTSQSRSRRLWPLQCPRYRLQVPGRELYFLCVCCAVHPAYLVLSRQCRRRVASPSIDDRPSRRADPEQAAPARPSPRLRSRERRRHLIVHGFGHRPVLLIKPSQETPQRGSGPRVPGCRIQEAAPSAGPKRRVNSPSQVSIQAHGPFDGSIGDAPTMGRPTVALRIPRVSARSGPCMWVVLLRLVVAIR